MGARHSDVVVVGPFNPGRSDANVDGRWKRGRNFHGLIVLLGGFFYYYRNSRRSNDCATSTTTGVVPLPSSPPAHPVVPRGRPSKSVARASTGVWLHRPPQHFPLSPLVVPPPPPKCVAVVAPPLVTWMTRVRFPARLPWLKC